jgi:hypothetical protein
VIAKFFLADLIATKKFLRGKIFSTAIEANRNSFAWGKMPRVKFASCVEVYRGLKVLNLDTQWNGRFLRSAHSNMRKDPSAGDWESLVSFCLHEAVTMLVLRCIS